MPLRPLKNEYELFQVIAMGNQQAFATRSYGYQEQIREYIKLTSNLLASAQVIVQETLIKIAQLWQLFQVNCFQSWMIILSWKHIPNVIHKPQRKQRPLPAYRWITAQKNEASDEFLPNPGNDRSLSLRKFLASHSKTINSYLFFFLFTHFYLCIGAFSAVYIESETLSYETIIYFSTSCPVLCLCDKKWWDNNQQIVRRRYRRP